MTLIKQVHLHWCDVTEWIKATVKVVLVLWRHFRAVQLVFWMRWDTCTLSRWWVVVHTLCCLFSLQIASPCTAPRSSDKHGISKLLLCVLMWLVCLCVCMCVTVNTPSLTRSLHTCSSPAVWLKAATGPCCDVHESAAVFQTELTHIHSLGSSWDLTYLHLSPTFTIRPLTMMQQHSLSLSQSVFKHAHQLIKCIWMKDHSFLLAELYWQ